ncbi:MAG: LppX_LprAFG lipoprotein [Chloroflexi bacterium]|nr:LppX_LprAFG lipoprotein [Chloroflexota bacterium]
MYSRARLCLPLFALLSLLALALAACSSSTSTPTPASAPTPTPAPKASPVADVLAQSAAAMGKVTSFSFDLQSQGGDTPLPLGLSMRSASGQLLKSGALSATIKAVIPGSVIDLRTISIGGKSYLTDPLTGKWLTFDGAASPVNFLDPATGVARILGSLAVPVVTDAGDAYRVTGTLAAGDARFIAGSVSPGGILQAQLEIGKKDLLLRKVTLQGRITDQESAGIVRTLTLAGFNQPFAIQPPA